MKNLYLMVGIPGSGKSTYILNHIERKDAWISRDQIRFSIVDVDEEYFSHEVEVFEVFVKQINEVLMDSDTENIYVDATHINKASRKKILERLVLANVKVTVIWIKVSLYTALAQNKNRAGTRAFVPTSAIRRMYFSIEAPTTEEKFIDNVIIIGE